MFIPEPDPGSRDQKGTRSRIRTLLNIDWLSRHQAEGPSYSVVDPDPELYGQVGNGFGVTVRDLTLMRIRILLLTIMRNHATLITESVQAQYYFPKCSVPDPNPDPDPRVFGPPGSGIIKQL